MSVHDIWIVVAAGIRVVELNQKRDRVAMAGELDRDSESSRLHYNLLVYSALQDAPVTTRQWETPLVPGAKHRDVLSGQPPPVRVCTSKEEREALAWRTLVPK